MSASRDDVVAVVGLSHADDPVEALRDALSDLLRALVAEGCGPPHVTAMRWEVGDPARFHPARLDIELAYREVFAGFRPSVSLTRVAGRGLRAVATARRPAAADDAPVYGGYTLAELARQYSPRGQADMNVVFKQWSRDGAAFRARHNGLDLAYGPSRFETFDLFVPRGVLRPPVWIFIHGGYWQASDKAQHAQFAAGMLDAGYAVVTPNYGLAPETPLTAIVEQMSRLTTFLVREADDLCLDGTRIHVAGHSAGAHLAAMMAVREGATIRSALLLSGLFDLAPLALLPFGALLGLTSRSVASLSPVLLAPPPGLRIALAVGEGESDAFKRQSHALAAAWQTPAPTIVPGHHFSMLDGLNGGALLDAARSLAAG